MSARFGEEILARAEALAAFTERPGMLARSYLTPQHRQAGEQIRAWMRAAGMEADFDALGNVVGRYAGTAPDAPAVVTGSHMDTVVDAGKYDGLFGILAPIACVAALHRESRRLAFPIEVCTGCLVTYPPPHRTWPRTATTTSARKATTRTPLPTRICPAPSG